MNPWVLAASVTAGLAAWWWIGPPVSRGPLSVRRRGLTVVARLRRWRQRRSSTLQARTIGSLTTALASELRSGQPPGQAWQAVVGGWADELPGRFVPGADVVLLLERWARVPGWGGLAAVAVCWRVADSTGAGLADALDRIDEAMRHEHEVATEVDGQLASVRATATVLATLPAVAVAMGHLLGARPVEVLFGTPIGVACLVLGAVLALLGWWWLTSQVESVRKNLRW